MYFWGKCLKIKIWKSILKKKYVESFRILKEQSKTRFELKIWKFYFSVAKNQDISKTLQFFLFEVSVQKIHKT